MLQYLYAVVDGLPAGWRPPPPVTGQRVERTTMSGDLLVLTSAAPLVPPASPSTLALHHDVVASALEADALMPFRYGTTVPEADAEAWLARQRGSIDGALARVRGCVEMSVKLLRLDVGDPHAPGRPGTADESQLRALADHLVERAGLPQWRYRPAGSGGNVVASVAFLLPRPELADFLARIAPVASRAIGVAVVPTGPWPPYSFVPAFERAPLAPSAPPWRDPAADRRAG